MSFGFSVGDFMALVQLTTRTYQGWKKACGEYTDITQELDNLKIILSRVGAEIQVPSSLLQHQDRDLGQLQALTSSCTEDVSQLETIVLKYQGLSKSRGNTWDRIRLGQQNLTGLRVKLGWHIATLGTYLDIVGIGAIGRVENNVKDLPKMVKVIDGLAAEIRAGRREGSAMTTYENDEKEVWRQFRRELIAEGFSSEDLKKSRVRLRRYIKKVAEAGLLDEEIPNGDSDVPCVVDGYHSHAIVAPKIQQPDVTAELPSKAHAFDLSQASQSEFNYAIRSEVNEARDQIPERSGACPSDSQASSLESTKRDNTVRSLIASKSSSEEVLKPQVISDADSHTLKEQFKSVAELDPPRSSSCDVKNVDDERISPHQRKRDQQTGTELMGMSNVTKGGQRSIKDRDRELRRKQQDCKPDAVVGSLVRNRDNTNDEVLDLNLGIYRRSEQTNKAQRKKIHQDPSPNWGQTAPRKSAQHVSVKEDPRIGQNLDDTSNRSWSKADTQPSSENKMYREARRSTDRTQEIVHNPPYPVRLRRKKGREFKEHDVSSDSRECQRPKKGSFTEQGTRGERGETYGKPDLERLSKRPETKRGLGEGRSGGNDELGERKTVNNAGKDECQEKDRKFELGKSKSRGVEEYEKQYTFEGHSRERELPDVSTSSQSRAPSRPSSRQASTRDKRRPKAYKETHSSSYYEDVEVRMPTPPTYPSESMRRTPRLRRTSTTPLAELLPIRIDSPRDYTSTPKLDTTRAATAIPSSVLPLAKDEFLLPKRKHSLSKVSRLLSPKLESSLPKRKFSLPGLVFPKRDTEAPQLRTVRSSRSYMDSRLASTPSPFQRQHKTRL